MKRISLLIILATSCFFLAKATDYYVDATTGSNTTGDGSSGNPWQTITYALSQITGSGHTVYVAAGTYDTTLGETFPILMKNGVSLVGAGIDISIIDANSTNSVVKAVSITETTTVLKYFTIRGGDSSDKGGGVFITSGSALKISDNIISNNSAVQGGGICVLNSSPGIINNEIFDNYVIGDPTYGGGIGISGSTSSPIIKQNIIRNNEARNNPSAGAYGAGISIIDNATPAIDSNSIYENILHRLYATSGGNHGAGIYINDAGGIIKNNIIDNNSLIADYGSLTICSGIYISGSLSLPKLINNIIINNTDHAIWCTSSSTGNIINNTISNNYGDGIYISSASPDSILNNIISFNSGYGVHESGSMDDPGKVWYNLFYANDLGTYNDEGTTDYYMADSLNTGVPECANNIDGNPMFEDSNNNNYHLRLGSPAIDSGDPTFDYSYEPLPNGDRINIGAYGNTIEATTNEDSGLPDLPDYYVNAVTGNNDTGDGTLGNPWQTITYALSQITGIDHTVHVAAGTYNTTLGETFPIFMKNGVSLIGEDPNNTIINAEGNTGIIKCIGIYDTNTSLENFTITGGYSQFGAGIFISANSALTIQNNFITNNEAYNYGAAPYGGGIYISQSSSPVIINNQISNNSSTNGEFWKPAYGGGIAIINSVPIITSNKITLNTVDGHGGSYGGGLYVENSSGLIEDNKINNNDLNNWTATADPGYGEGIYISNSSGLVITGNEINNNTHSLPGTTYAAGIFVLNCSPIIKYNLIAGNEYRGIYLDTASPLLLNNTISDNNGDAIYLNASSPDSILNNIISLNSGYGIRESGTTSDPGKVWYNLFYANDLGLYFDEGSTDYYTAGTLNTGVAECANNIDGDPMFVDRENDDYYLRSGSPAIDAGDPDPQFNDPDGSRNDIGALAFDSPPAVPQNLSATTGAGEITLRWNPNTEPDLDQYNIYRDLSSPAITLIDSVISTSPPDTFYVDTGLIIGQDYYYRITALDTERNESDFSGEVSAAIPFDLYTDSLALVALYDSTDGANWTNSSNWHIGNVSTWYGITVSGDRVTQIDLSSNNLVGTIPPSIGDLDSLQILNLPDNQLTGTIPAEIGNLENLQHINLNMNQLTGSIPAEIGNLTNLTRLWLGENQLSGSIPAEIGNLTNLTNLQLQYNQLSGSIPIEIGNLTNLTIIDLSMNQLSGSIPTEIGSLTNLQWLHLYGNQFIDLPDLSSLVSLDDLRIQNNRFTFKDIEPNIGVASATFTYSPQDSVGEIIDTTVYTGTNFTLLVSTGGTNSQYQWKKDGTNIGTVSGDSTYTINPVALSDSGAYTCEITNTVATDLTLYSRPVNVSVEYPPIYQDSIALVALYDSTNGANWTNSTNWLFGNVSTWYGITVSGGRVTEIILDNNNLAGTIPASLGNLTKLKSFDLYGNQLQGQIPSELASLNQLEWFHLDGNPQLTPGPIPSWVFNLTKLTGLHIAQTNRTGTIPTDIANLTFLNGLNLAGNQLSGSVPTVIGNLTNLTFIEINNNKFTDLPDLSSLTFLVELNIQNNKFTFKDIEPNIGVASTTYTYSPQDSVGEIIDTTVYIGTSFTLSVSTGGDNSLYQWKKDGTNIGAVSSDSTYTINPVTLSDSGTYTCKITNTVATELTLYSRPVNVSVPSTLSSENDILSFSFAEQTGAATIDAISHTVDIEVVYGTNLANLVATFSISSQASMTISSVAQISGVTANDFTNSVTYTVTAEDGSTLDWIITANEAGILIISDFPYSEDFESGNGGWRTGGTNSSWQLGNPAGPTINSAASGTVAWVTNLAVDYNQNEVSYVTSPRFDLSGIEYPKIVFSIWWDAEGFYDGANFQYKHGTDVWKTLGKDQGNDSWYNSQYIYSIEKGFGFDLNNSAGWSGDGEWGYGSNGWVTVDHALTGIDYQSAYVTFRIAFASNSGYENDGIAFDNINIFSDPTGIDLPEKGLLDIQIYPNPNECKFRLVYNGKRDVDLNLQLINLQGQVVLSEQIKTGYRFSKEFDLDYLPPGLYYFRLMHKEGVVVKKMVIR